MHSAFISSEELWRSRRDLRNSSDDTQSHSLIENYFVERWESFIMTLREKTSKGQDVRPFGWIRSWSFQQQEIIFRVG